MTFTPSESKMLELLAAMPGRSYCPDADDLPNRELVRILKRLERKGAITIEQVDVGYRYTIKAGV